jgi:membrane-bound lytic murein transglycosylase D
MNKFQFVRFLLPLLVLALFLNATTYAKDTIIVITKPASPEKLAALKAKNDSIEKSKQDVSRLDSSRFTKNRKKEKGDVGFYQKSIFKVNETIYGAHTGFISNYVQSYHQNFGQRLTRIQRNNKAYFKLIDNVMRRFNLPREMKSLAVIESAMNCNAVSPVGAVGPWQFMEGTAKMMGLRVDEQIDERRDFYKSTHAAARYLKKLHGMFHDWLLVIASYNCGPAPVLRAINTGQGRSFWDIKPKLPKETQNHVMAFIATSVFFDKQTSVLSMGALPKGAKTTKVSKFKSNLDPKSAEEDMDTDVEDGEKEVANKPQFTPQELSSMAILKVKGTFNIQTIARYLDEDPARLKRWNPTFEEDLVKSTAAVHLRLPIDKIERFIIEKEKIISESAKGK